MSTHSKIRWTDSTVNPVMGCDGCPLFPTTIQLQRAVTDALVTAAVRPSNAAASVKSAMQDLGRSEIYHRRSLISKSLVSVLHLPPDLTRVIEVAIARHYSCYASVLHLRHGENSLKPDKHVNPGYARVFEEPKLFPDRMQTAARTKSLTGTVRPDKPWLDGLPRLIFTSDMGDALFASVPFDYLKSEVIDTVNSPKGTRHLWQWLTKRPSKMAKFAQYLGKEHGMEWPANLVAMTSVLDKKMAATAVDQLRRVPAAVRGLSVEPLSEPVVLDLHGIDWVIVGGESGHYARPFDLAWARSLREQCQQQGVAFFLKQLGAKPIVGGSPLKLKSPHGGDWEEWPVDLRVREMPEAFRMYGRVAGNGALVPCSLS